MSEQMLTPERLRELRRVAKAAVQGDWFICHPNCRQVWVRDDGPFGGWCVAICDTQESGEGFTPEAMDANARHISTFDPPTVLALLDEIEQLRREREVLVKALMPASEALADLDKSYYRVAKQDPGGYVMGSVSVASLVTAIEATRKALALLDGEEGGGDA